jgi:hypothetical protein
MSVYNETYDSANQYQVAFSGGSDKPLNYTGLEAENENRAPQTSACGALFGQEMRRGKETVVTSCL